MIKDKTVFILGAGASQPYGYPTGENLRDEICKQFPADLGRYLHDRAIEPLINQRVEEAKDFADKFYNSMTHSIDLFLARNPQFINLGKKAIIFRIFSAEKISKSKVERKEQVENWYSLILHKLTDELVRKEDYARFSENNVSFITFNYDRSFEYFFYEGLLNSFEGISKDEIKEQLQEIRIIHVFEQVAGLEWQDFDTKITYGRDINSVDNMEPLIENLRIVYEESENPELQEAHKIISEADRIFFLGFGYAKENLEALKVPEKLRRITNVYGTAWHFKPREIGDIITRLQHGDTRTHIKDMDCLELLREYL